MQWNKKSASLLAVLTLLLGSAGAIGLQAHAQQSVAPNPPAQVQAQPSLEQADGVAEKSGVEANENLPGGGHQDQNGVNVDHQFEGVE